VSGCRTTWCSSSEPPRRTSGTVSGDR